MSKGVKNVDFTAFLAPLLFVSYDIIKNQNVYLRCFAFFKEAVFKAARPEVEIMGTILNSCKDARKKIREVEKGIGEAVVAWKYLENGRKEVAISYTEKCNEIRYSVIELKGKLETISIELEKDSDVRAYYDNVYNMCIDFFNSISENE